MILNRIVGEKIIQVETTISTTMPLSYDEHDKIEIPVTLVFEEYILNIYNPFVITGINQFSTFKILENSIVEICNEASEYIVLEFTNKIKITIDLREKSFEGPEALSLYGPDNLIVVWN